MGKLAFSKETYIEWYKSMLLMRKFEEKAGQLYGMQKIKGFCHLYIGQEAVVAGAMTVLRKDDNMITAYRDHAHAIAKGVTANEVMAELCAKVTGCSKGKGGSMHMFSAEHRFFGGHGIVGGQIPLGAGIAFADQYNGSDRVTVCYMGDGAVRQGAFHEALNMAMLWKLPVIFVCENNKYAMGTSVERTSNITEIYKMGSGFGIPSKRVDGMNCEEVHKAMDEAVSLARSGGGPSFLEMYTYRYKGHSMSDPAKYRPKEELEEYKIKDPLDHILGIIKTNKLLTDAEVDAINEDVKNVVDESVRFSDESPYPDVSELYKDVYVQDDYPYILD